MHEAVDFVGRSQRHVDVLLDHDDRHALGADPGQDGVDVLDDRRRQTHRQFVAKQKVGIRHQGPADRDHLLLSAGQRRRRIRPPLLQGREERVHRLQRPASASSGKRPDPEVLFDRQTAEQAPPLGDHRDPAANDLVGRQARRCRRGRSGSRPPSTASVRRSTGGRSTFPRHWRRSGPRCCPRRRRSRRRTEPGSRRSVQ